MFSVMYCKSFTFFNMYKTMVIFNNIRFIMCGSKWLKYCSLSNIKKSDLIKKYNKRAFCDQKKVSGKSKTKSRKKNLSIIIPPLSQEQKHVINHITGISIGFSNISWMKVCINPTLTLLEWNAKPFPSDFRSQMNEADILKMAYNLKSTLPNSDLYVMETFSMKGKELISRVNEIHLSSMLIVLLNGINQISDWKVKVIFQKQNVINQLYNLLVGSERVSSKKTVELYLKNFSETNAGKINGNSPTYSTLQVSPKFLECFKASTIEKQEDLSVVFLLTLSFIEVNIFENKTVLEKLNNVKWQSKI